MQIARKLLKKDPLRLKIAHISHGGPLSKRLWFLMIAFMFPYACTLPGIASFCVDLTVECKQIICMHLHIISHILVVCVFWCFHRTIFLFLYRILRTHDR